MFVYLSKRIAIPNGTTITSIGWHEGEGWLACGGTGGLLKVLKVDAGNQGGQQQKFGGLSLNQTLERHETTVTRVVWNEQCRRLTSSDAKGQIVVWTLHKGMWFEGMVNNRNKSEVVDLAWSVAGKKICIAYADGVVTVGGVDGNRLWTRNLETELERCCWSPDDQYVLFATKDGRVLVHEAGEGHPISRVTIQCLPEDDNEEGMNSSNAPSSATNHRIVGLTWCPTWVDRPEPLPMLAICYDTGHMQLMRSIGDDQPMCFNSGIPSNHISWNPQGTVLVVCGVVTGSAADTSSVAANFFNSDGVLLRTLRVPGKHCGGVTWEGDGLRIALAVDSSVYFANIRPQYRYGFLGNTAIYSFNRPDKVDDTICYWNTITNDRKIRQVRALKYIGTSHDACLTVSQPDDSQTCMVQLSNAIGCPIRTRFVPVDPVVCGVSSSHVVVCGEEKVFLWQLRDPSMKVDAMDPLSMQISQSSCEERLFHIEDIVRSNTAPSMTCRSAITNDVICACSLSETHLIIGRESGTLQLYQLPPLQLIGKRNLPSRPQQISFNCNSSTVAVLDVSGVLRLYAINEREWNLVPSRIVCITGFERKDVWCLQWAEDDPRMIAFIEKTRLFIFNGLVGEEAVHSTAHLSQFKKLRVRGIQFDELLFDPEKPRKECTVSYESLRLRQLRELLATGSRKDAVAFIEAEPCQTLWETLAEDALLSLDLPYADVASIATRDYPQLHFLKRVRHLDDPRKQQAEVESFYRHFEESEKIYKTLDRKDLALAMRRRLGDWFGVVRLVQEGGGDESQMTLAWEYIGDSYAEGGKWSKAAQYYAQAKCFRKLSHSYYVMENYEMLTQVVKMVEHDRELLIDLGKMLLTVGMASEASQAFLTAGEPRMAVEGCVSVNLWEKAISISEEHQQGGVAELLQKYAKYLIRHDKVPEAIELYRKAGEHDEAARMLSELGKRAATTNPLQAKKYYVLAALEVNQYRRRQVGGTAGQSGEGRVDALLTADKANLTKVATDEMLNTSWRGAEAYHYYLICQEHILKRNLEAATVVAVRLMEYDDVISLVDTYCLVALTAYLSGNFALCSKAFSRLEAAEQAEAAAGSGQVQTDFTMELDVTAKTMSGGGATMLTGGGGGTAMDFFGTGGGGAGSLLSGMTMQLTNPAKGALGAAAAAAMLTYPTVPLNDRPTPFADLAVKLFTAHAPLDHTMDSIPCGLCNAYNREWASACVKCGEKFHTCIVTGRCISGVEDSWECAVCLHRALDVEIERYMNCPLCHSPIKQRMRRAVLFNQAVI